MKLYIYPDGEVFEMLAEDKSDDFFVVDTEQSFKEIALAVESHFGPTVQSLSVMNEVCEYL